MHFLYMTARSFYNRFIAPHSHDIDDRRREFILNVLLCGLAFLGSLATTVSASSYIAVQDLRYLPNLITTLLFASIMWGLLWLSRRGRPQLTATLFMIFLLFISTAFVLLWSVRLPIALLMFALVIVIAGVLFTAPQALRAMGFAVLIVIAVGWLQIAGYQEPYTEWEGAPIQTGDVIGYILFFILIGIVSWLSNRETDRSLTRARESETALAKERDNLEQKVIERTRELEDLQAARLLELQPFAEFGRIGASLVHDIANPLTAASLHLEELNRQQHSELVLQVQRNLSQLEKYLFAARKQIRRESELRSFAVGTEVKQVAHLLTHRARRAGVKLEVKNVSRVTLYGDVVKFDQLLANIIANAIDASKDSKSPGTPTVTIAAQAKSDTVTISVTDHGIGIKKQQIRHIFEPFYSTKASPRGGLGLGLALVKQYVENDFRGSVTVTSSVGKGTTFTLQLKGQKR